MPGNKGNATKKANRKKAEKTETGRGVATCLTWRDGYIVHDGKNSPPLPPNFKPLPPVVLKQPDVGRSLNRGYVLPDPASIPVKPRGDDESVGEALRGWPKNKSAGDVPPVEEPSVAAEQSPAPRNTKQKGKKGAKNAKNAEDKKDPFMSDLISHRYQSEYVQRREEENRKKEEKRLSAEADAKEAARNLKEVHHTRASQLRAISLAPKVATDPSQLWKMQKFEKKANARITTFRPRGQRDCADEECAELAMCMFQDDDVGRVREIETGFPMEVA